MFHRSRYRRAFASLSAVAAMALAITAGWIIGIRESGAWYGVSFGDSERDVIAQLGEPWERFEASTICRLAYRDMEVWLRQDAVYCVRIRANPRHLYAEACMRYGLPVREEGDSVDWFSGRVLARLFEDEIFICRD